MHLISSWTCPSGFWIHTHLPLLPPFCWASLIFCPQWTFLILTSFQFKKLKKTWAFLVSCISEVGGLPSYPQHSTTGSAASMIIFCLGFFFFSSLLVVLPTFFYRFILCMTMNSPYLGTSCIVTVTLDHSGTSLVSCAIGARLTVSEILPQEFVAKIVSEGSFLRSSSQPCYWVRIDTALYFFKSDFYAVLPDCSSLTGISPLFAISLTGLANRYWMKKI